MYSVSTVARRINLIYKQRKNTYYATIPTWILEYDVIVPIYFSIVVNYTFY